MKKAYTQPQTMTVGTCPTTPFAQSGGVGTGSSLGKSFNEYDVTYSRRGQSLWDEEAEQ